MKNIFIPVVCFCLLFPGAKAQEKKQILISNSHGYEIALGWWGWSGGSSNVADKIKGAAEEVLADPSKNHGFEYDGVTWQALDKYYPLMSDKVRMAVKNRNIEIVGGTFAQQLSYMVNTESNIRQMLYGTKSIYETVGQNVKSYSYQEFTMCPQLPYMLHGVGIENSLYENHLGICGRLKNNFRGSGIWESNDGSTIKVISNDPYLMTEWHDAVHLVAAPFTLEKYFETLDFSNIKLFNPNEEDFYFDAGGYTSAYGNLASVYNCLSENKLLLAERFATLSYIEGGNDFSLQLDAAWKALLASQNHDIMYCGSEAYGVEIGSSNYESGRYLRNASSFISQEIMNASLEYISEKANTNFKEKGKALVVFNPLASINSNVSEKEVNFNKGEVFNLNVEYNGQNVPFQLYNAEKYNDGSLKKANLVIWAKELPALGYRVYQIKYVDQVVNQEYSFKNSEKEVENNYFRMSLDKGGRVVGIYDKQLNQLILGSDESFEPNTTYDRTLAYCFRNTFGVLDYYKANGWEIIEKGAVRSVVCSKWESKNANIRIYHTFYEKLDRIDLSIEYESKNKNGDLMDISEGEKKEALWFDFHPTFEGKTRCNTIADFLEADRDYYYSNSWLDHKGNDKSFLLMHKGIHAWHTGFTSQIPRDKREWSISAELVITLNEWVPGMLRFNQKFSNEGPLHHNFSIVSGKGRDLYENEREVANYYFTPPAVVVEKHKGEATEKTYVSLQGKVLMSALTFDVASGKEPVLRLWNPNKSDIYAKISYGFNVNNSEEIRIDGTPAENIKSGESLSLRPVSLKTIKLNIDRKATKDNRWELISSAIPYKKYGDTYTFDAPMEAYRFSHHYVKFRDEKGNIYMQTDPYDELEFTCKEGKVVDNHKYWEGNVFVPKSFKGKPIRFIAKWYSTKGYGFGTCILTDDYTNRADEPVILFVNGKEVTSYDGDVTDYIEFDKENTITIKVLYEKVPLELLMKRPSVMEYGIQNNAGMFETLVNTKLRIGRQFTPQNIIKESDVKMVNSDFASGLSGWKYEGNVAKYNEGINNIIRMNGKASLEQTISVKSGNYYFMIDSKIISGDYTITASTSGGKVFKNKVEENDKWQCNRVKFVVPEGIKTAKIVIESSNGEILFDDVNIIANKVAKEFY